MEVTINNKINKKKEEFVISLFSYYLSFYLLFIQLKLMAYPNYNFNPDSNFKLSFIIFLSYLYLYH